jgi:hypothetical protein
MPAHLLFRFTNDSDHIEHIVEDDAVDHALDSHADHYLTLCGHRLRPAPLIIAPAQSCVHCERIAAARRTQRPLRTPNLRPGMMRRLLSLLHQRKTDNP